MSSQLTNHRQPKAVNWVDYCLAAAIAALTLTLHASQTLGLEALVGQFSKYPLAANRLLSGSIDAERLYDFSPLYLRLCAAVADFMESPFQGLLWIQLGLVALAGATMFILLRRHFNRALSLAGSVAFALTPSVMVYGYIFEPEPLILFLLILLVCLAESEGRIASLAAGITLALCLLTRPGMLALLVLIPIFFILNRQRQDWLISSGLFLLPILVALLLPILSANSHLPPPLMNPGTVFFEGHNPLANGRGAAYPALAIELGEDFPGESDYQHAIYRLLARRSTGKELTPAESNRYWVGKAINFIVDEPLNFLRNSSRKLLYLFHNHRWHDLRVAQQTDLVLQERMTPFTPIGLVSALAIVGLLAGLRHFRRYFLYYAAFFSQAGLMITTYASDRQRLALLPFLVIFAVIGLHHLCTERRHRLKSMILVIGMTLLFTVETGLMLDNHRTWDNYIGSRQLQGEATAMISNGLFSEAFNVVAQATALTPWAYQHDKRPAGLPAEEESLNERALKMFPSVQGQSPSARLDQAILLIAAGRYDQAKSILSTLEHEGHQFERTLNRPAVPAYYLGRIAALQGDDEGALEWLRLALNQAPGDPAILAQLAILSKDKHYRDKLERYFSRADSLYYLGLAALDNDQGKAAAESFQLLSELLPEFWKGQIGLAAALEVSNMSRKATEIYLKAMQRRADTTYYPRQILSAFRRRAESSPPEDIAWYWYGRVLRQYGLIDEARNILERTWQLTGKQAVVEELRAMEADYK